MPNPSSPHDEYFKAVFTENNVRDFINGFFPEDLTAQLDLNTLTHTSDSFVDKQLKASYSDIVFQCDYGTRPIQISLLFEHKSSPEPYARLQLLRYMLNSWEGQLKNGHKLMPVIPVIIYHGKAAWKKTNLYDYFKGIDPGLQAFIPEFDYLLADIGRIGDEQIRYKFQTYQLQVSLQMMKYIFDEEELKARFQQILSLLKELLKDKQGDSFFEQTLIYIFRSTNLEEETVVELSKSISPKGGEIAMTTAEKLEQRGEQRGEKRGEEKGIYKTAINMIKNGAGDKFIKDCTSLSDKEIQKLRKEHGE